MKLGTRHEGKAGVATNLIFEDGDLTGPSAEAQVAAWFIHAPGQSAAWDKYLLSIYHLRPIEGVKEATKLYPGITHEVLLAALNPEHNPNALDVQSWQYLRPINYITQVEVPGDEQARTLVDLLAIAIADGALWAEPPLSGQREPWDTSVMATTAHMRGEPHAGH